MQKKTLLKKYFLKYFKQNVILILLLSSFQTTAQGPQFEWATRMGGYAGTNRNDAATSLSADGLGNVYVTGVIHDTADFDTAANANAPLLIAKGAGRQAFVAKYDAMGHCIWAIMIGGDESKSYVAHVRGSIVLDGKGNLFVTSSFNGTIDFDKGTGINTLTSRGGDDVYLAKYDTAGNFLWAKSFGSNGQDESHSIATDAIGNVYISGGFSGSVLFDPAGSSSPLISNGINDGFVAKYDEDGNYMWARRIGGNGSGEHCYGVAVDSSRNLFAVGSFQDVADFGIGSATVTSYGGDDGYLVKYDSNGNCLWGINIGGSIYDVASEVAVNELGDAFITGYFMGVASFNPNQNNALLTVGGGGMNLNPYVAKYDANGNYVWAVNIYASGLAAGDGITLDAAGNVYTTGFFSDGIADFDPNNPNVFTHTSVGSSDIYIAKYDGNDGRCLWAESMGSSRPDGGRDVKVDDRGHVFLCGEFKGEIDFDPGVDTFKLICAGYADGFVVKFACNDTSSSYLVIAECGESHTLNGEVYTTSGIYEQYFLNTSGCDSTVVLDLTLYDIVEPVINVDGFVLGVAGTYVTYQWIKDGTGIPGATNPTYTVTENSEYQVKVTDDNGCEGTSAVYEVNNVSIDDRNGIGQYISIYPNPANDIIHINSPVSVNVNVFSIEGKLIFSMDNLKEIPVKNWASGMYLIQIKNQEGRTIKYEKVIKQ